MYHYSNVYKMKVRPRLTFHPGPLENYDHHHFRIHNPCHFHHPFQQGLFLKYPRPQRW